ncbi:MAG: TIGR04013 family B12-binding domain/radical SAM domain-containing protein [Candidatus Bathyarchaeota archaeon]|nr:MAG: TIGR04013 family B12-binding domain/radical SAM domain-containing protein [Candidatus Bathyarchaeota archaeon]
MSSSFEEAALLLCYRRLNRHSFNALVGAIETREALNRLPVHFVPRPEELLEQVGVLATRFNKVIVAFSLLTCQILETQKLVKSIKRQFASRIVLIGGGPHPSGDPAGTLGLGFDIIVRGEGEEVFPDIVERIVSGRDHKSVNGLAFLNDGGCTLNPLPRRLDISRYPPFAVKHKKFGPIEISRGCPWTCRFCQTPYLFGVKVRHRDIPSICKYVNIMRKEGLTDIRFISPNAFMYGSEDGKSLEVNAIEGLLSSVRKILGGRGRIFFGTFPSEVRPESVTRETIEVVKKYCANDNLVIGGQSGSERMLEHICRGHTVDEIQRAVDLTLKSGLKANVDLIFGLPHETEEDARLTLELAKILTKKGARIHAHTFMPLVGTPFKNMPAGEICPTIKIELERLISIGKVYGQWRAQEVVAKQSYELRRKGLIR